MTRYINILIWKCGKVKYLIGHIKYRIHNLLTHSSGITEYFGFVKLDLNMTRKDARKKILQYVASKPLEAPIGKKFKYNTNFVILDMIIEKITTKLTLCLVLNIVKMENEAVVAYSHLKALTLFGRPFYLFYLQFF